MIIVQNYTIPTRGIGKPDYSNEVSRAIERKGISLQYGETLRIFGNEFTAIVSPYPWFLPPLGAGLTSHLMDVSTGLLLPTLIPAGYTISLLETIWGFTSDAEIVGYFDTFPVSILVESSGGDDIDHNRVIPLGTDMVDPLGATTHLIDMTILNRGLGNLEGSLSIVCLLKEVGSEPLPKIKTVRCKHCGNQWEVPNETTNLICPKCTGLTIVFNTSSYRRSA